VWLDVVVVGAINVDLVAQVDRRPAPGETVLCSRFERHSGGKGANQAAAAARAGASTALVGAVGDDADGPRELAALAALGVDVSAVSNQPSIATGLALITVTPDAENAIVIVAGANGRLGASDVTAALGGFPGCSVLLAQTEVVPAAVDAAAAHCRRIGSRLVINTAPVVDLEPPTLAAADPLVANEHEARQLCGGESGDPSRLADAVRRATGARSAVVTLGARGAAVSTATGGALVPAVSAVAVDTTGAGDTFVGTLAAALAHGVDVSSAAALAVRAAAEAITWRGARAT
jgi:ribokinase